jgi:hypothetical protein
MTSLFPCRRPRQESLIGADTLSAYSHGKIALLVLLALTSLRALAHDPYEITSTLSLYSNRTELRVEMEARTALLFAGHNALVTSEQIPGIFTSLHEALTDTASRFLKLTTAGRDLHPEKTSLLLGVEDHLQFTLQFPRVRGGSIHCEARVLQAFTNEGPYGISLTVLDLVNKKVLGQSVLFKGSSAADFPSQTSSETLSKTSPPEMAPSPVVKIERSALEAPAHDPVTATLPSPAQSSRSPNTTVVKSFPLLISIAILITALWSLMSWRAKRKLREL